MALRDGISAKVAGFHFVLFPYMVLFQLRKRERVAPMSVSSFNMY
jgi:hypothetical protein